MKTTPPLNKFRLPDKSLFAACYDEKTEMWMVELRVTEDGQTKVFSAIGSGIHWTLRKAGQEWAKSKKLKK